MAVVALLLALPLLDQEQSSLFAAALVLKIAGVARHFLAMHWWIVDCCA